MSHISKKYTILIFCIILVFQSSIILYPGWREDDVLYFLIRLKQDIFGNALNGFTLVVNSERFTPFNYFGYQIVSYLSFEPIYYYLYNYILSLTTIIILSHTGIILELRYWPLFIFLLFVPGHADSYYQLVNPEKELILFWSVFLYTIVAIIKNKNIKSQNTLLIFSYIFIVFSLFMKETTFIILVTFCVSLLILNLKYRLLSGKLILNKKIKYILLSGVAISIFYLVLYFFFTINAPDGGYHYMLTPADSIKARIMYSAKALVLYSISDPFLIIILPSLFVVSIYYRFKKSKVLITNDQSKHLLIFDVCFITAISLTTAYVVLGFHGYRYLLPAYPFGMIAIAGYLQIYYTLIKEQIFKLKFIIPCIIIVILLINSIISSINLAVFYKVSSYNFMKYKEVLINYIQKHDFSNTEAIKAYFPGKDKIRMNYSNHRHNDLLKFYEISTEQIIFEYNNENSNWIAKEPDTNPYSTVNKGEILLLLPNSTIAQDQTIANLSGLNLRKVIHTYSPNYYEIPEIRHLLKFIMLKKNPGMLGTRMIFREVDYAIYEIL